MMVDVTSFGKRSGLTGDTLMYMVGCRRYASMPPQQAAAISTTYGTSCGSSMAAAEKGLRVLRSIASVEATASSSGGASVGPSSGMITSTFGSASSTRVASATSRTVPAGGARRCQDRTGTAGRLRCGTRVTSAPSCAEGERVGAVPVVELVVGRTRSSGPTPRRDAACTPGLRSPGSRGRGASRPRACASTAMPTSSEQGVGSLFDSIQLRVGQKLDPQTVVRH